MQLQAPHLGVGEEAVRRQLAPERADVAPVPHVPAPGPGDRPHPLAVTGQDRHDELSERQQCRLRQHADEVEGGVALQNGSQLVTALEHLHGDGMTALVGIDHGQGRQAPGDRLAVAHPGVGGDDHPRPRHLRAPREVEILPHGEDPRVEALELAPQVGPDQGAAPGRHEDVAHRVVLPVVDLPLEDAVDDGPCLVTAHPDVQEDPRIVPVDELGRDDPGVGAERLLDQAVDAVRVQGDVVVEEKEERRAFHHVQGFVRRLGVSRPTRQVPDERVGQGPSDPLRDGRLVLAERQDQDGQLRIVLCGQRRHRLVEPGAGVGRHDDRDHCRHLGVHEVEEASGSGFGSSGTELARGACNSLTTMILLYVHGPASKARLVCPVHDSETSGGPLMTDVTTTVHSVTKSVTDLARDVTYVAIGLGVLGYQRLQVHRVDLANKLPRDFSLDQAIGDVRGGVSKGLDQMDELAESATKLLEITLQPLEERLPPTVGQLTAKAREQAREVRSQIRQLAEA